MALLRRSAPQFGSVQLQYADAELRLPGGIFSQVTKIGYSAKIAREEARGLSRQPMGNTRGVFTYDLSLAINRSFRTEFLNACQTANPDNDPFSVPFPIIVSFNHPQWDRVETDTVFCVLNELNFDSSPGPAVLSLDIPCYCPYINFGSGGSTIISLDPNLIPVSAV